MLDTRGMTTCPTSLPRHGFRHERDSHGLQAPPGAPTPGCLRDVGSAVGQYLEALDNDLTGAAGLPRLLPAPPL
jgi:hypothetical protein